MARIMGGDDIKVVQIRAFLGLNENPDGETTLKVGEFSRMRNFRVTQDHHLQKRPGAKTLLKLTPGQTGERHLFGVWHGAVGGAEYTLLNYDGKLLALKLAADAPVGTSLSEWITAGRAKEVGTAAAADTHFFGFDGKVYLLDGTHYAAWDGGTGGFQEVEGYAPLIQTATTPGGSGTLLENVNRLTAKRRVEFSPDGKAAVFVLPEREIGGVDSVTLNGEPVTGYTVSAAEGKVTFTAAPAEGTNTLEIAYHKGTGARAEVTGMRYSELFNGAADTRVFLYGDGSNKALYSGVRYDTGKPSAEYFPDLGEVAVGEGNTPLTALVRHYGRLMAYKPSSAWVITAGSITTRENRAVAAFYVSPVNRQFGNEAAGQVKLLENDPLTLDNGSVYLWHNSNGYISNSENNAKRISDRVGATLAGFDLAGVKTYNLKRDHEFWLVAGRDAVIYNYANDTWYIYTGLPFRIPVEADGEVYGFGEDGRVVHVAYAYHNDDAEAEVEQGSEEDEARIIDCYAETGAMDFGRDWQLKYSPMLFVAIRPEAHARIYVTVESNRRSGYPEKLVSANLSTFSHVDFAHFSFITNRKPQVRRLRMKVKKAAFYRIIYKSHDATATATVIETDVRLRLAGMVK